MVPRQEYQISQLLIADFVDTTPIILLVYYTHEDRDRYFSAASASRFGHRRDFRSHLTSL